MTTDQLRWVLAGAKGPDGSYVLPDSVRASCPCLAVYDGVNHYLDGPNNCCKRWIFDEGKEGPNCICHGLGYTPALDLETWLRVAEVLCPIAVWNGHSDVESERHIWFAQPERWPTERSAHSRDPLLAVLLVWAAVLREKGVKLEVNRV